MVYYRLYRLSASDHITSVIEHEAPDDDAAIYKAESLDDAHLVEVWRGTKLIARVASKALPLEPATKNNSGELGSALP